MAAWTRDQTSARSSLALSALWRVASGRPPPLQLRHHRGEQLRQEPRVVRGEPAGVQQLLGRLGQDLQQLVLEVGAERLDRLRQPVEHGQALHVDEDGVGGASSSMRVGPVRVLQDRVPLVLLPGREEAAGVGARLQQQPPGPLSAPAAPTSSPSSSVSSS